MIDWKKFDRVLFDLDSTLVDSSSVDFAQAAPRDLLELAPPGGRLNDPGLRLDWKIRRLPGCLIAGGYDVGIMTQSSAAFASTLLDLLNIDFERIKVNVRPTHEGRAQMLGLFARREGGIPQRTLFVAGFEGAAAVAASVGCHHWQPAWSDGDTNAIAEIDGKIPAQMRCVVTTASTAPLGGSEGGLRRLGELIAHARQLPDSASEIIESEGLGPQLTAAVCGIILRTAPGHSERRRLQEFWLAGLGPEAASCTTIVLRDGFERRGIMALDERDARARTMTWAIDPRLVTRSEIAGDKVLRQEILRGVGRCWVRSDVRGSLSAFEHRPEFPVFSHVPFRSPGGVALRLTKDWDQWDESPGKGRSGPNVKLGLGWMPALAVAETVKVQFPEAELVPVPSTSTNKEKQPAQYSERLAWRVALLRGQSLCPTLEKDGHGKIVRTGDLPRSGSAVLIDDQTTKGTSLRNAAEVLGKSGVKVVGAVTWSASRYPTRGKNTPTEVCWWGKASRLLGIEPVCLSHP